jgi:hypothetical protein
MKCMYPGFQGFWASIVMIYIKFLTIKMKLRYSDFGEVRNLFNRQHSIYILKNINITYSPSKISNILYFFLSEKNSHIYPIYHRFPSNDLNIYNSSFNHIENKRKNFEIEFLVNIRGVNY